MEKRATEEDKRIMISHTKGQSVLKHLRRRNVLGISSVALATALAGLTANAQEKKAQRRQNATIPRVIRDKRTKHFRRTAQIPIPLSDRSRRRPADMVPFRLVKKRMEEGGWTREVTERVLPSSITGVNMRLTAGSYRELHWHAADDWAYVLYGQARVTATNPDGTMFIGDVSEDDLWIFPAGCPHSIHGLGPDGTECLLVFNQGALCVWPFCCPSGCGMYRMRCCRAPTLWNDEG